MPVEGVLRHAIGGQVNDDGVELYKALSSQYGIVLTTEQTNKQRMTDWLDLHGIMIYDDIVFADFTRNVTETPWANLARYLRTSRGYNLAMCVVNGPRDALDVLQLGIPCLMFSQPAYGLPEWLPGSDKSAPSWRELVTKVVLDTKARALDTRARQDVE
jgi:hypothetical protein